MHFEHLLTLRAVVEEGGVTRAAERLGLTQPAVTARMRGLEAALGRTLFRRRGNRLALTEAGAELFEQCRGLLALWDDLAARFEESGRLARGRLRLGADGPFGVMELVRRFRAAYPGVVVRLEIGNAAHVVEQLARGVTDAAVVTLEQPPEPRWHGLHLGDEHLAALLPAEHPLAARERLELAELAGERLVFREPGSATRTLLEEALARAGLEPRIALELGSREAVREAVAAGLGVSAVLAGEQPPDPRLRLLPLAAPAARLGRWLLCLAGRRRLRLNEALFALARGLAAGPPDRRPGAP